MYIDGPPIVGIFAHIPDIHHTLHDKNHNMDFQGIIKCFIRREMKSKLTAIQYATLFSRSHPKRELIYCQSLQDEISLAQTDVSFSFRDTRA